MIDPNDTRLTQVLADEAKCKARPTCPRLGVREVFFEPNPGTLGRWQSEHQFYAAGIDPRVVFVCESPSDRRARDEPAHFTIEEQRGWICWNLTSQDARFRKMRVKYGFENCLITNAVKCGLMRPSTPANLTREEVGNCAIFLRQEIEAVHPRVLACLGGAADRIVREHVLPHLSWVLPAVRLTHYSHRCSDKELFERWERELMLVNAYVAKTA